MEHIQKPIMATIFLFETNFSFILAWSLRQHLFYQDLYLFLLDLRLCLNKDFLLLNCSKLLEHLLTSSILILNLFSDRYFLHYFRYRIHHHCFLGSLCYFWIMNGFDSFLHYFILSFLTQSFFHYVGFCNPSHYLFKYLILYQLFFQYWLLTSSLSFD